MNDVKKLANKLYRSHSRRNLKLFFDRLALLKFQRFLLREFQEGSSNNFLEFLKIEGFKIKLEFLRSVEPRKCFEQCNDFSTRVDLHKKIIELINCHLWWCMKSSMSYTGP